MSQKHYIFVGKDGSEIARKVKSRGRPPVGPTVHEDTDGNIVINNCITTVPDVKKDFRKTVVNDIVLWYPCNVKVDPDVVNEAVEAVESVTS